MTTATLLTPPGTGAIATITVEGPQAWPIARELFSKSLPESPVKNRFWFGRLAGDDVILSVVSEDRIEIHCHGGRQVVRLILDELTARGCSEQSATKPIVAALGQVRTLRATNILLDQWNGAFAKEVQAILDGEFARLEKLSRFAPLGQHLVEPWKVVIAGAPNVGKSSLINALAGYERAVVSPVAGTTRDVISTLVALDGWPVEMIDTAGLRNAADELEAAGVDRAREILAVADLILWVCDATQVEPIEMHGSAPILVANKCDLPEAVILPGMLAVSAKTGTGVGQLAAAIVRRLVPQAPEPGDAVPYTRELADKVLEARELVTTGKTAAARQVLAECLSISSH